MIDASQLRIPINWTPINPCPSIINCIVKNTKQISSKCISSHFTRVNKYIQYERIKNLTEWDVIEIDAFDISAMHFFSMRKRNSQADERCCSRKGGSIKRTNERNKRGYIYIRKSTREEKTNQENHYWFDINQKTNNAHNIIHQFFTFHNLF